MRIAFYSPGSKRVEQDLGRALIAGAPKGVTVDMIENGGQITPGYDIGCTVGVKTKGMVDQLRAAGIPWLYFDKAYNRDWPEWWRVAVCAHQPTDYLMKLDCPDDRVVAQGWSGNRPWREHSENGPVLFAGASLKYHRFVELGDPTEYAQQVVDQIKARTDRRVIYRPKPSWSAAEPIEGSEFSWSKLKRVDHPIQADLAGAHVLVTHGSAAALDAMLAGVPAIVLGHAVTREISSTTLDDLEDPYLATAAERAKLLANLAYCQWRLNEIAAGAAWRHILQVLEIRKG
jgi:hypothetical protein